MSLRLLKIEILERKKKKECYCKLHPKSLDPYGGLRAVAAEVSSCSAVLWCRGALGRPVWKRHQAPSALFFP